MSSSGSPAFPAETVMKIATGFMESKYLFAGVELGIFEALARGPVELKALADRMKAPVRTVRVVADGLVALGLLARGAGGYSNAPAAQSLLAGEGSRDLRPALRLYDRISYPNWFDLTHSVRTGEPARRELSEADQRILSEGVDALSSSAAATLPFVHDFTAHRRLMDLGGGTGSFLRAALERAPQLSGTLIEWPAVAAIARTRLAAAGLANRVEVVDGDILEADLPKGHDAVLVANVMHLMGPEKNIRLLRRVRESIAEGGRLLLVDFFTDSTRTRPLFAALMAGSFLTGYGEGDVYSEDDVAGWLAESGFMSLGSRELAGAARLMVASPANRKP